MAVLASDIPARMTLADYRKRTHVACASPWKMRMRRLRAGR